MLTWESALRREYKARLAKRIYTLHNVAEDLHAAQSARDLERHVDDAHAEPPKEQKQLDKLEDSEDENDRKREELRLRELQETRELLALQQMLPGLLQAGKFKEAEGAVCCFLDRNPRSADGFVLLAETYAYQNQQIGAITALWGAIQNCPGNRRLLRLVDQYEESYLMERCEMPVSFKVKALQAPLDEPAEKQPGSWLSAGWGGDAPVIISRQGLHIAAFANKNMEPGDLVFKERPFVCTPLMMEAGQIFSSCFHCLQEREDPARAFSCPISPHTCPFVFCSWKCLMRNGRLHAIECKCMPMIYAAAKESRISVTSVLHIFRTLVKCAFQRETCPPKDEVAEEFPADVATLLLGLNSYDKAVKQGQPELYKKITTLTRRFQQGLPPHLLLHLPEKELIHFILVVLQYSPFVAATSAAAAIERKNPECTLGRVLAPATAMLHHSCVPTATISLQEDGQVAVRAITFIPSGGYICLSAEEDLFKPQKERKAIESPPRVFGCGCLRCTDNEEGGRLLRGIRCTKCVRGFLCPAKGALMLARLSAYGETGMLTGPLMEKVAGKATETVAATKGVLLKKVIKQKPVVVEEQEERAPSAKKSEQKEHWLCNSCGLSSKTISRLCEEIEKDILQRQKTAEEHLVKGAVQVARRAYSSLIAEYSSRLHPQHAVLFNAHTMLAGLHSSQPAKNLPKALILLRRAIVAAESVLPPTSMTKVHLYLKLSELTYQAMQVDRQCRRGPSLPPEKILEPLFCALWNCVACMGNEASLSVVIGLRLRRFAALLGVCTPPLLHVPVMRTEDVFFDLCRAATNSAAATPEQAQAQFTRDPMFIAVALVRQGHCFPLALELFRAMKGVHHLPTGLSLLGLACLHSQDAVVRELLAMNYDLFATSHLGMTPLLVMCAAKESLPVDQSAPSPRWTASAAAAQTEEAKLKILRLMLQHCDALDSHHIKKLARRRALARASTQSSSLKRDDSPGAEGPTSKTNGEDRKARDQLQPSRMRLLFATAHRFLGQSHALHFAASNGKARLCRQLLAAGSVVGVHNAESATPLHLACIAGSVETVKVLLDNGADVNAATLRGETPLVLAVYWLHEEVTSMLLERGADCDVVTRAEGMTVLHAVAAGVLRQTKTLFRGLAWEGDPVAAVLEGLSAESAARGTYTRGGMVVNPADAFIDLRLPSASPEDSDLFLFPGELLDRMAKAQRLVLTLMRRCQSRTHTQPARNGLAASDLLIHSWENFQSKRNQLLKYGNLRFSPLTPKERGEIEEQWHFAVHQIYVLRDMLRPAQFMVVEAANDGGNATPREADLKERQHQQLLSDAPWYFPDEVRQAANRWRNSSPAAETTASG